MIRFNPRSLSFGLALGYSDDKEHKRIHNVHIEIEILVDDEIPFCLALHTPFFGDVLSPQKHLFILFSLGLLIQDVFGRFEQSVSDLQIFPFTRREKNIQVKACSIHCRKFSKKIINTFLGTRLVLIQGLSVRPSEQYNS